jgi:hypothetical protein
MSLEVLPDIGRKHGYHAKIITATASSALQKSKNFEAIPEELIIHISGFFKAKDAENLSQVHKSARRVFKEELMSKDNRVKPITFRKS